MTDLFDKHRPIAERFQRMMELGVNAVGITNDKLLSPTCALIQGRETILAGTNNYMGITFEPSAIAAGKKALDDFGTGTTGSRIANGSYAMHKELERELAKFLNRKHCIVFTTGYQANLGMISGLAGARDTVYLDADSHSSIYDGCTLSGAKLVRFRHNDAADLDKRLSRSEGEEGGKLVVLEGIYSMLGDRAPLKDFVELKRKHNFQLLVDEAHSFGVLGPHGRGLADEAGLEAEADFVVGTFSKSIGSIGGFGSFVLHALADRGLLDGACRIEELLDQAQRLGQKSVAVTEHGNMFSAVVFHDAARKRGITPILGCEVYVAPGSRFDKSGTPGETANHLVLLAENDTGFKNLIKLVSAGYTEGFYYKPRIDKELLARHASGLIGLSSCLKGEVATEVRGPSPKKAMAAAARMGLSWRRKAGAQSNGASTPAAMGMRMTL